MREFTIHNKTHHTAELSLTSPSHSYANQWRHDSIIG